MYFKRLEMQGFKSFADPVTIDFHEGITCVVGPNGSGKSNISDAIRWVLGEQSPKALRGGKMEEVIFAGTASRKSRGMAEVVLVIDNSTGILDIDYNEVAITRRMYRSGESEYLINNNPCRLRDIRELIMDTGIGVDGYSIIGQGKIADIVSTKPEARREIFEEAAGVVMYKTQRREAERKLESTSNNLERLKDIINELESRIDTLKEDSIKAKEYLELKKRYEELEINVILRNIDTINENSKVFKDDIERIAKEIEDASKKDSDIGSRYIELSEKRELLDKLSGEARDNILKLVQEISEINNAAQLSQERLSGIEKETGIISGDIRTLSFYREEEEKNLAKLNEEENALNLEISNAKRELDKRVVEYNEAAQEQARISSSAEEGKSKLFELNSEIASCESEIKGIENIVENLLSRKESLTSLSSETGEVRENLRKTVEDKKQEKDSKEKEKQSVASALEETSKNRESLNHEIRNLTEELERDRIQSGQFISRMRTMEELESNYDGYTAGVKAAMRAGIPGTRGVVAELMDVPKGYELAIETALGGKLQNIICERDENAKQAVNYLKDNRAGRATFLPIETISPRRIPDVSSLSGDEGYIGIAGDIVSYDDELKNIYSYLLGATVVTKTMDSAIRLAKKGTGLKFVTLEGEIVNAQGAITGGIINKQTANILERKAEINDLAESIKKLDEKCKNNEGLLSQKRMTLGETEVEEQRLFGELHRLELELSSLDGDIKAITESLDKEEQNSDRYAEEMNRIATQMLDAQELTDKHKTRIAEINDEILIITEEVEKSTSLIENSRKNTEEKSEEVTKARITLNEIETKGESQKRLSDRVKAQIEEYGRQINEKEGLITALAEEKNNLLESVSKGQNVDSKIIERQSVEESLKGIDEERDSVLAEIKEIESKREESAQNINDLRDQKYQLEVRATRGETQLETLKEKLWEEFEMTYAQASGLRSDDFVYSRAVKETREIRNRIRELGDVNVGAIQEYEQVSTRYEGLTTEREDVIKAKTDLERIIDDMDKTIKEKFKDNFDKVVDNFHSIFVELFGGGQAELRLEDEDDPLNSGIEIVAQPPGKKLQNINLMSGGEKTMTAIALMFAVLKTKPTPFCILDEVEAALDDNNIDRFANYLKNFNEIQFTLVTHQKATMEHADVLYGVTMPEHGVSKMLSLRLGDKFDFD